MIGERTNYIAVEDEEDFSGHTPNIGRTRHAAPPTPRIARRRLDSIRPAIDLLDSAIAMDLEPEDPWLDRINREWKDVLLCATYTDVVLDRLLTKAGPYPVHLVNKYLWFYQWVQ